MQTCVSKLERPPEHGASTGEGQLTMETIGPTQTEFRLLESVNARELEALEVFAWDLRSVRQYVGASLIDIRQGDEEVREMAWDAVLVRYTRVLKMVPRNAVMACIDSLPAREGVLHRHFLDMRNKLFAHQGGVGTVCKVTVVSEVDSGGRARTTAVACQQMRVSQLGTDQAEALLSLIDAMEPRVELAIQRLKTNLFADWGTATRQDILDLKMFSPQLAQESIIREVIPPSR